MTTSTPKKDDQTSIFNGAMTGMGLASSALAEDDRTLTPVSVTGRVIEDQGTEALEVILQMKAVRSSASYVEHSLINPIVQTMAPNPMSFAGWGHHPMMYGYGQHPAFYRPQPPVPPPPTRSSQPSKRSKSVNPGSAPTPVSIEAISPAFSAATPAEVASEGNRSMRGESVEPKPTQTKKKKGQHPFTQQPLKRAPPKEEKGKEVAPIGSAFDILTSLATRLNSVDGSAEPPPPDTEEGQLLDCMIAWLKTAAGARMSEAIGLAAATPAASSQSADGLTPAGAIEIPGSPVPPTEAASSQSMSSSQLSSLQSSSQQSSLEPSSQQLSLQSSSQQSTSQHASSSQPKPQLIASSNTLQSKPGRIVLGNRANVGNKQPAKRVVSDGKGSSKSVSRSTSGPQPSTSNGGKKRSIDESEHGVPNKAKRQKTGRSVSNSSVDVDDNNTTSSSSLKVPETVRGKGTLEFPSTSEILGIKFAPRRAYSANLGASGSSTAAVPKKTAPEPETPKQQRRQAGTSQIFGGIAPTSPFISGDGADESLFSEAGSPVKNRTYSPFKPMGRRASDADQRAADAVRPSSPCERRAKSGGAKNKEPKTPVRMLGRGVTRSPSPPDARTPQPQWAVDLPPSSPPPPSSPVDSTPTELEDEEDSAETQQPQRENVDINESPSKIFARYFDLGPQDEGDLAASLLAGTSSSFPSSDNELGSDFTLGLEDSGGLTRFDSSTSFQYNEYNWSESALMSSLGERSEGELDRNLDGNGAASDIDFDVGDLLGWITQAPSDGSVFDASNLETTNPASEGTTDADQDPLRVLLGGCVV